MINNKLKKLKIAIVYDRVNKWGGAERVLLVLHKMFPEAPLYTSVYNPKKAPWARVFPKIYTSFLQRIPFAKNFHEGIGWLMPLAFESFDFSEYDLVISVTSEAAKGIITKPETLHVCYMLTPTRYLWSHNKLYFKNPILRFISKPIVKYLQYWDKIASKRLDKIIAISTEVQRRVKKYYKRESEIIFPPLNLKVPKVGNVPKVPKKYFLVVSRLVGYKKVDLVVKTFNKNKKELIIVGTGSQFTKLNKLANKNIKFVGNVNENELEVYYKGAKALIMPQVEDFGLVSVEAQSCGVPVIAYNKGGVKDSVIDGVTGLLFDQQNEAGIVKAIAKFEKMQFNHRYLLENAKKFEKRRFERQLQRSLIRAYFSRRGGNTPLAKV